MPLPAPHGDIVGLMKILHSRPRPSPDRPTPILSTPFHPLLSRCRQCTTASSTFALRSPSLTVRSNTLTRGTCLTALRSTSCTSTNHSSSSRLPACNSLPQKRPLHNPTFPLAPQASPVSFRKPHYETPPLRCCLPSSCTLLCRTFYPHTSANLEHYTEFTPRPSFVSHPGPDLTLGSAGSCLHCLSAFGSVVTGL